MRSFPGRLEPRLLGIVAAVAFALWLFIEVAEEVVAGDAGGFDRAILRALGDLVGQPAWLKAAARDITALGSFAVLGLLVTAVVVFLLLARRRRTAFFVLLSTTSGTLASQLLKLAFERPRPVLIPHDDYVVSASFPSGHAMLSAVVYLTLGALLASLVESTAEKLYLMSVALGLSVLVGISRLYLGVHWPTDVLAGWAAGAAWALCWWGLAERIKRRAGDSG